MAVSPLSSTRRRLFGLTFSFLMLGCASVTAQNTDFQPSVGQPGKDVIWVPTPDALVNRMLRLAQVTPEDRVVDLGSGDGKIVIAAARDFKARARGIEYNPDMVALSQRNARQAGVADMATFEQGDIFVKDFSEATVVTMYLLPNLNLRLRHTLLAMKPGTRLVSHQFTMGEWQPDETSVVENRPGHLWIVPANAGGQWRLTFPQGGSNATVDLSVTQTFQKIEGNVQLGGIESTLRTPRLDGPRIHFAFTDNTGALRQFSGTVDGNRMQGTVTGPGGATANFTAQRSGDAPPIGGSAPVSTAEINGANIDLF